MRNDIIKLNTLMYKESGIHHELEQGNILIEGDFVGVLKEAEMESIQMQDQLDALKEEKERLLNSLVEAEYVSFFPHGIWEIHKFYIL